MTEIFHEFPPDVPVAVVLDCSAPSETDVDALALMEDGIKLARNGDVKSGTAKMNEAQAILERSATDRVTVRPFTDDEVAQKVIDDTAHAARLTEEEKAATERQSLLAKLASGKATDVDRDTAIAQLLGGGAAA